MISYKKFKDFFNKINDKLEPELRIIFEDRDMEYMIIKYRDFVTFQRCGINDGSGEIKFKDLDEIYNTRTIDGILLKEEWENIRDIFIDDMYSLKDELR